LANTQWIFTTEPVHPGDALPVSIKLSRQAGEGVAIFNPNLVDRGIAGT
jgi:hypothetical protein